MFMVGHWKLIQIDAEKHFKRLTACVKNYHDFQDDDVELVQSEPQNNLLLS